MIHPRAGRVLGASGLRGDGAPTDGDLDRWWDLVTDAAHVEIERGLVLHG